MSKNHRVGYDWEVWAADLGLIAPHHRIRLLFKGLEADQKEREAPQVRVWGLGVRGPGNRQSNQSSAHPLPRFTSLSSPLPLPQILRIQSPSPVPPLPPPPVHAPLTLLSSCQLNKSRPFTHLFGSLIIPVHTRSGSRIAIQSTSLIGSRRMVIITPRVLECHTGVPRS